MTAPTSLLETVARLRGASPSGPDALAGRIRTLPSQAAVLATDMAGRVAPLGVDPLRYDEVVGLGYHAEADGEQVTLAHLLIDRQTGLVRIAQLLAHHRGAGNARMVEAAMAGAVMQVFDWPGMAGSDVRSALGFVADDTHIPGALDVPAISVTLQSEPGATNAQAAALSTALAIVNAIEAIGIGPVALPIEPDTIFHQLAEKSGKR